MANVLRKAILSWLLLLPAMLVGCGGGDTDDPCLEVSCSGHGRCAESEGQATCLCDPGYRAESLSCVLIDSACENVVCDYAYESCEQGQCVLSPGRCRDQSDCPANEVCSAANMCVTAPPACDGIDCSGHGQCVDDNAGGGLCQCDDGWKPSADGHDCLVDDPCLDVSCNDQGVCSLDANRQAVCNCEHGYRPEADSCVADTDTVTWCAVWYPKSFIAGLGDPETMVYGRIYQDQLTTLPDAQPVIHAQLGYSTKPVSYPVITTDLTWVDAGFNLSGQGDYQGDHEYMGAIPSLIEGQYNYLYRFSIDSGESWTYCDTVGVITDTGIVPGQASISGDNPDIPVLALVAPPTIGASSYSFQVRYTAGQAAAGYDPANSVITLNGEVVNVSFDDQTGIFDLSATDVDLGKFAYLFRVKDTEGHAATLFVPFWVEAEPFDWTDAFLYQILTDRFVNGNLANDDPIGPPTDAAGDWQGGDFAGVVNKIEDGYFAAMGVNVIWISSPIQNTEKSEPGKDSNLGHVFSAYHAYWPIATGWTHENPLAAISSPIDHHFGSEAELRSLVETAHTYGIRVLVDFVPNHVHTDAPLYQEHQSDDSWWHLPYDYCGSDNGWDDRRFTCWFDPFLPDFNCSNPEVRKVIVDHAIWLVQEFNLDGFRVDATKHVVSEILLDLRAGIEQEISTTGLHFYMVGETLTGNDAWVKEIVGTDLLDGSVNDPLHYKMVDTFLTGSVNPWDFDGFLTHNDSVWTDHYADTLMVNFLGSHDTPRAISIANGDDVNAIWDNRPQIPTADAPFQRLRLAQTFLLTYRSIPVLFMGDEFGMPGACDPDNRRMMVFDTDLSAHQSATIEHARKLGKLREQHVALRQGDRSVLLVDDQVYSYGRKLGNNVVLVAFNTSTSSQSRSIDVSSLGLSGSLTDALGGGTVSISDGQVSLTLPALTAAVYVP